MICKDCNEQMIGDGFTTVYRCPNADTEGFEPDAGPINCGDAVKLLTLDGYIKALTLMAERHPELLSMPVYADNPEGLDILPVNINDIGIAYLDDTDDDYAVPLNSDEVTPLSIAVFCIS